MRSWQVHQAMKEEKSSGMQVSNKTTLQKPRRKDQLKKEGDQCGTARKGRKEEGKNRKTTTQGRRVFLAVQSNGY